MTEYLEGRGEHRALQSAAPSDSLVRIQGCGGNLLVDFFNQLFNGGRATGAANDLHAVDVLHLQTGVREAVVQERFHSAQQR